MSAGSFLDSTLQSFTQTTADYVQPAVNATVNVYVRSSAWIPVGLIVAVATGGTYQVTATPQLTVVTLKLLTVDTVAVAGTVLSGARVAAGATTTGGGGGGVTAHSALTGLIAPADDHTQLLHIDGRRALQGDLSCAGNRIKGLADPIGGQDAATRAFVIANATPVFTTMPVFGSGYDGDLSITLAGVTSTGLGTAYQISGTTVTLLRDIYLHDLTISGPGSLNTAGFLIFGTGKLDILNASANAIQHNGAAGLNAVADLAPAELAQPAIAGSYYGTVGRPFNAHAGIAGTTGVGAVSQVLNSQPLGNGGGAGGSGAGGAGGSGAGGTFYPGVGLFTLPVYRWRTDISFVPGGAGLSAGGAAGAAGGAGAGDGTNKGGGSGNAGLGGGVIWITFATIARGASTAPGAISAKGGAGGNGGNGVAGNTGGGGGSPGGGGGWVYLHYLNLTGSAATGMIDVSSGAGGNGGNGHGTGTGGDGSGASDGGRVTIGSFATGLYAESIGTGGNGSSVVHSGTTGGVGRAAVTYQVSL